MKRADYEAARGLVAGAKSILVSGHLSPDGDSLGSMVALVRMLSAAGKRAFAAADIKALGKPGFLIDGTDGIIPLRKLKKCRFDLFIYVDASSPDRLPPEVRPFAEKLPTLTIDHHATSNPSGVSIVDPEASSAGELVWRFAKWMEWPIDRKSAEALWVAIITDTGRFAHDSTKPGTLRTATDLLKRGVRTSFINDILYNSFSMKAMELKRRAWRSLHVWKNRKVAEITLTRTDFREVRGTKAEAEDAIEIPRSVAGNQVALFFYQIPDRTKEIRVSIRTRVPYDAAALARGFGGGGHVRAAGCTVNGGMASAKRLLRKAVKEMLARGQKPGNL